MGMFIGSIRNIAGDYQKASRWCLANLTDDDANDDKREKLTQLRIVGIDRETVRGMHPGRGTIHTVNPARIQRAW